jgi:hypothetical protein
MKRVSDFVHWFLLLAVGALAMQGYYAAAQQPNLIAQPYLLDTGLVSRSISFENPTGAPGEGGKAASELGPGRKGDAARPVKPGETVQLADIEGSGTIRHIWLTTRNVPSVLRGMVIRAWWDGQEHPSIECPLGDFFGVSHGKVMPYQSAVHSVSAKGGLNVWLPMPFAKRAKFTITNESDKEMPVFFQMTYTLGDKHPNEVGRLHVLFRRENPTTEKQDFEILPLRKNKGRYIGTVIGVRNLQPGTWWGEGEIKIFMDGDAKYPTITGTGTEDYVGLAWGLQPVSYMYHGCNLEQKDFASIYRWHLPDPIAWQKEGRITIQQLAYSKKGLLETSSDWCCSTFWYEPTPSEPLPPFPDVKARTSEIWKD